MAHEAPPTLPTGTVTFLFTDIEGSTRLLQTLGADAVRVFEEHAEIIRTAVAEEGGIVFGTEGDAFFAVFELAATAVTCAVAIQRRLASHSWPAAEPVKVRIGVHTGEGSLGGDNYFGIDVHRASRVADTGHGGQIVLSEATAGVIAHDLGDGVALRDRGAHRLKDITEPEHLFDLEVAELDSVFPPLRAASSSTDSLPTSLTSFVGRTQQVDDVVELFDTARLVTCTGPGGVGKSRLSLQVARTLAGRFDGTFFVPLAPVSDPDLVAVAMLTALGVPPGGGSAIERLPAVLENKSWFIVLDNFEQVVDAAPIVATMLTRAPNVSILITSRTALRIAGERVYQVPPLGLPEPGQQATDAAAVRLFVDRATDVRPDLQVDDESLEAIVAIVTALDGLPLAIELAAARVRVLPPTALRQRLGDMLNLLASSARDVDERQRTLRGAIEWSYDLLTPTQQSLLEDFSVFRGGATLDTIEATCGLEREYWEWLEDLDALVGHSLVTRVDVGAESRFLVLELIREFGAERLADGGREAAIADNHLAWFVELAEHAAEGLLSGDQRTWLQTLETERGNVQQALHRAMEKGDTDSASRLVFALWRFWHMRGPIAEGGVQADKVLAMEGLTATQRLLVLEARGGLAWWAGDMDTASANYTDALALARAQGSSHDVVNALYNVGLAMDYAEPGTGTPLLEEGLKLAQSTDDVLGTARIRWGLANAHQVENDFPKAHEQLLKAYDGFIAVDDVFMLQWTNRELGVIEIELDRLDDARTHLEPALEFFAASGDLSGTILLLRDHARLAAKEGESGKSLRLIGAAQAQEADSGLAVSQFEIASFGLGDETVDLAEEDTDQFLAEGRDMSLDAAIAYAKNPIDGNRPPVNGT